MLAEADFAAPVLGEGNERRMFCRRYALSRVTVMTFM
jgi:hypothetical protein